MVLALGVIGAVLPVPYVVLSPGPTENTIGTVDGKPVITIIGRQSYPTDGSLSLVTVAYQGGPTSRIYLMTALRGWLDPNVAVVPEESIFPPSSTAKQVEQQNTAEMVNSQDSATAAALTELKIPFKTLVTVAGTQPGKPADGKLKPGEEIDSVDGTPVTSVEKVAELVRRHKIGDTVTFGIAKGAERRTVELKIVASPQGTPIVGVTMRTVYRFPFTVKIDVGEVGGPSAGMMFSLGIMDKLTPESMTGGKAIAGTGTITPDGAVGPIGGIAQKMAGARKAGSQYFLSPAENCAEALKARPEGLTLVKVEKLHDAVKAVETISTGKGSLPSCATG